MTDNVISFNDRSRSANDSETDVENGPIWAERLTTTYEPILSISSIVKKYLSAETLSAHGSIGGSGGGGKMEARIAKLESDVGHIKTDISDIKTDVREMRTKITSNHLDLIGKISETKTSMIKWYLGSSVVLVTLVMAILTFFKK